MTSSNNTKSIPVQNQDGVVLQGYHKKLKTMKKKYFVLCAESGTSAARLEYYDSEKKFKSRSNPKRTIILKTCFNINRRLDTKHKFVIALSTKEEGFCIVLESEDELNKWLKTLLSLQRGEDTESEPPKPTFEHVWQVQVQRKGLAEEKGIIGSYHVCLTSKSLTLVRIGSPTTSLGEARLYSVEFYLTTIRRCGDSQCYFYMEVGRHSAIGAGELWMETEDTLIAQNMHRMILNEMSTKAREDTFGPMRKRSSSANEASKPISVLQRRQTHSGNKPMNSSPLNGTILGRDRSDSLPSRNRTASECSNQSILNSIMPPPRTIPSLSNRPHSMYNNRHSHSHSPPMNALSPSTGCSESDGSSLSIDETDSFGHSLTPDESGNFVTRYYNSRTSGTVIPEENCDDFWYPDNKKTTHSMDKLNNHPTVLSLPITNQNLNRKGSPGSQGGSTGVQGQYMDMHSPYSPCGSSPCDQTGSGYIANSPGVEIPRGLYAGSSGGHSRASSLAEETVDGYVPMGPPQPQDYVDMEQSSKHQSGLSSAASSCSITSGTPSTDIRFAEYPLDKVKSRFTPDDEDIQSTIDRPMRAYSVGSRLEHNKRKLRVDVLNAEQNNSRVRAFSVGSRAKVPRSDLYRGAFLSNLPSCQVNNNNIEISTSGKGKKSSSAPILVHKSQSSVDRMDDLMEIDYSKTSEQSSTPSPIRFSSFPVAVPARPVYDPHSSSSPKTVSFPGYVEMKPGSPADKSSSLSSIKASETGYLEMKPVGLSKSPSLSSSPIKAISSPKSTCQHYGSNGGISGSDYMNISPSTKSTSSMSRGISSSTDEFSSDKIMEVDHFPVISSTPEGYMEMSFGKSKKPETKSEMRMPIESKTWENRSVSMPIDIKTKDKGFSGLSPSGSQAPMFPFSPCSPIKTFVQNDFAQRKCLVDATSGTVTISEEDKSAKEFTIGEVDEMEITPEKYKILNTDNFKIDTTKKVDALTNDYADMSLSTNKRKTNEKVAITEASDYVNYVPPTEKTAKITETGNPVKNSIVSPSTDYAVMNANPKSMVGTVITSSANSVFNNRKCVPIALENCSKVKPNCFEGFKPISAGNDELLHSTDSFTKKVSSKPTFSQLNRNLSDKNKKDDNSGYELLQMRSDSSLQMKKLSRPNSVNSEKISPLKASGRPNSANSDCILSISTSSSTSTLCGGSSSSSSTLCGSKSSPATSRPQSFSDSTVASRPESVGSIDQGISSRPPSVSSERELHYASLDLPPSTTPNIVESNCQNSCGPTIKGHSSASGESSTSPSPNAGACQQPPTFTYAQIDFNKSESLKLAMNAASNNS